MKQYLIATIVIAASVIGCDETIYKIELAPKGNQLNRTLTVWRQGTTNPDGTNAARMKIQEMKDDELAAIAKAYSQDKHKAGQDLEVAVKAAVDPNKPMPYLQEGLNILEKAPGK